MKQLSLAVAATLVLSLGAARAAEPPEMKEGLWSVHSHTVNNPGNKESDGSFSICRNHAYDAHVHALVKDMKGCTVLGETSVPGKYASEMRCTVAATVIQSKGTTTYQGDSAHSETHATYTPAMGGIAETSTVMDQKYAGNCPAGSQPGDRIAADGTVTHLWRKK